MYNDIVEVNKDFQTSVNIDYDLKNTKKIREYIPTSDVCDVLKIYFKAILGIEKNNSTILVGPYGKGKSFLVLSLLQIISLDRNEDIDIFLKKVEKVDLELFGLINEFYHLNRRYLPVIIDSNYYNIEQSFMISLDDALKSASLDEIIPNTVYDVCLDLINKWENDPDTYKKILNKCAEKFSISLDDLKLELKHFDINGYHKFENLYNCITTGLNFNPMINSDIVKIFSDVNHQLYQKGYAGIFIVYDEFNKTLEAKNEYISKDLKIIQDFAEKAARSSNEEKLHLCCVTHKSLTLYQDKKNSSLIDTFKTVEGRFKEIRFNRSLDQNYQIISLSLNKKDGFETEYKKFVSENKSFLKNIKECEFFEDIDTDKLCKECFPFNPVSIYALIQLSESIAQNERTMFTLISDNEESSFSSFITNNNANLYNVDYLYNYFSKSFSSDDGDIKTIWYRCESSLTQVKRKIQKRILKALACIRMINDFSKFSPNSTTIALCLKEEIGLIEDEVKILVDSKILKTSFVNSNIDFAYSFTKEIDSAVESYLSQKKWTKKDSDILDELNDKTFYIPRKYNAQNKITRYFRSLFVEKDEMMNISSFDVYFEKYTCDGLIINVFGKSINKSEIKEKFNSIKNNSNVVLRIINSDISSLLEEARNINALNNVFESYEFDETTKIQIGIILKEKCTDFVNVLNSYIREDNSYIIDLYNSSSLSEAMHNVCQKCYSLCPIVNNEMINKEVVSTNYKKSRDVIINDILNRINPISKYSKTSPEMTVFNSFYEEENTLNNDTKEIVTQLRTSLSSDSSRKISLENIVKQFKETPYGIRTGILPVYFAIAFSCMSDSVVLYYENAEIEVNANNIDKFCHKPESYYILVEPRTRELENYFVNIIESFGSKDTGSYYGNIHLASSLINKWFLNLPIILKEIKETDNYLNLKDEFFKVRKIFMQFNINDYDAIVKALPTAFGNNFKKVIEFFNEKETIIDAIKEYVMDVAVEIKTVFDSSYKGTINGAIKEWINANGQKLKQTILDSDKLTIYQIINNISYDDAEAVNQLSSGIIKYRVEDWSSNNTSLIIKSLRSFVDEINNDQESDVTGDVLELQFKNVEVSSLGKMFENNVESIVDEFNDSISNEEKVYILMQIAKKYSGK